jgi:hypothetical protein
MFTFVQNEIAATLLMTSLRGRNLSTVEVWLPIVQQNLTDWVIAGSNLSPAFLPWSLGQPNGKGAQQCVSFERTAKKFEVDNFFFFFFFF